MAKRIASRAETSGVKPKRVRSRAASADQPEKPIWEVFEEIAKSAPARAGEARPQRVSKRLGEKPQSISHIIAAIGERAAKLRGRRLPKDLARNHDYYLYGPLTKRR
jgi:hypothetical protein